jgi:hypothetical protein
VTRRDYQRVFDWLQPINDTPILEFDTGLIYALRDKAFSQRKRRFANYVVQVVRILLQWGNPTVRGELISVPIFARDSQFPAAQAIGHATLLLIGYLPWRRNRALFDAQEGGRTVKC